KQAIVSKSRAYIEPGENLWIAGEKWCRQIHSFEKPHRAAFSLVRNRYSKRLLPLPPKAFVFADHLFHTGRSASTCIDHQYLCKDLCSFLSIVQPGNAGYIFGEIRCKHR